MMLGKSSFLFEKLHSINSWGIVMLLKHVTLLVSSRVCVCVCVCVWSVYNVPHELQDQIKSAVLPHGLFFKDQFLTYLSAVVH